MNLSISNLFTKKTTKQVSVIKKVIENPDKFVYRISVDDGEINIKVTPNIREKTTPYNAIEKMEVCNYDKRRDG